MTNSPAAARLLLGAELRRLREQVGLRVEDAAGVLDCSTAKISRLENGKGRPYWRDIRDLLQAYGASTENQLMEFRALATIGSSPDWTDKFRDVSQAEDFSGKLSLDAGGRFILLERDASALKWFERDFIPGLLQAPAYIEALRRRAVPPPPTNSLIQRFVEFRLQRQQAVLRRRPEPPAITSVVSELALMPRQVVSSHVMKLQLEHLLERLQGELSWIDFRVLTFDREPPDAMSGPFYLIRFQASNLRSTVYLEGREEPDYLDAQVDVDRYEQHMHNLLASSLTRHESLEKLEDAVRNVH